FAAGASLSGTLDGGGGVNALDYSAWTTGVVVNLATGQATGVGGRLSRVGNVLGGAGADTLTGDGGNNVLIGGGGADGLDGGGGEDLLIGGTPNYDHNVVALRAIFDEWARTDLDFAARVADLTAGVGPGGVYRLNATTVHSDGQGNTLIGGDDADWLFSSGLDLLPGLESRDKVTPVGP